MVIAGPEDLVPERLTECLRGALPVGRVTAVHPGERRTTIVSTIVPLRVEYSPDAPSEAPPRLLLKATRAGLGLSTLGHRAPVDAGVWQQSFGIHPSIWWPHLHRVLAAFEDLGCAALLS